MCVVDNVDFSVKNIEIVVYIFIYIKILKSGPFYSIQIFKCEFFVIS